MDCFDFVYLDYTNCVNCIQGKLHRPLKPLKSLRLEWPLKLVCRLNSLHSFSDFFQKDQIFIILEFEFGGVDLENSDGTVNRPTASDFIPSVPGSVLQRPSIAHCSLHLASLPSLSSLRSIAGISLAVCFHSVFIIRTVNYPLTFLLHFKWVSVLTAATVLCT